MLLAQSASSPQASVAAHFETGSEVAHGPPQSWAVSWPFLTPSEQVGARHVPSTHDALLQSPRSEQALVLSQGSQKTPPQSMSLSPWFFMPSEQVAAEHLPFDPQRPLAHSLSPRHGTPGAPGPPSVEGPPAPPSAPE